MRDVVTFALNLSNVLCPVPSDLNGPGVELKAEDIILAKEPCNFPGVTGYIFSSLKGTKCVSTGNKAAEDESIESEDSPGNQNDAEIKILETISRETGFKDLPEAVATQEGTKDLDGLNVSIFADRVTCEYCQETNFRANKIRLDREDYLLKYIDPYKTSIRKILMQGAPLMIGEKLLDEDLSYALKFINDVETNRSLTCAPFR